jgi:hypothetical protein
VLGKLNRGFKSHPLRHTVCIFPHSAEAPSNERACCARNASAPLPGATHRNAAFKETPFCSANCDTQQLDGFPLARLAAQIGGEQKTNREIKMNIDGGQRMEREHGSQWDES